MNNKNTNTNEHSTNILQRKLILPPDAFDPHPIRYSINTYTQDVNTGVKTTGDYAYCDSRRVIRCDISIIPSIKFKSIKRVLLLLENMGGSESGFQVLNNSGSVIYGDPPFAYVDNRYDTNGNITYRVIDITSDILGGQSQTISLVIQSISGNSCTLYTDGARLEVQSIKDDDFIPNVSKIDEHVGTKGKYSVNTRNGKLFYTQTLFKSRGKKMPFALSMTYNAADCDTSSPNGIETGIKGWTFNYAQTLKTDENNYTLLDGAHMYRKFKPSSNNSVIKYDESGKNGLFLTENSGEYTISDGKNTTYVFDSNKRLVGINHIKGSSPIATFVTYDVNGRISAVTDGMADTYTFSYGTDTITVSKGTTALVELTLADERLTQVKYLLSNETYNFTYNTSGELITVNNSASNKKTAFEYYDSSAVSSVKNYIVKENASTPTDSCFFEYRVLETRVEKCRNTDNKYQSYRGMVYMFAESGETIFVCDKANYGKLQNMRFRTKNEYEKYSANIIDLASAAEQNHYGVFTFADLPSTFDGSTTKSSNAFQFDTTDFKSENFVFSAKIRIDANSFINKADNSQYIKLYLKENETTLATLKFDLSRREYQVKSAVVNLPRGNHRLTAHFDVGEIKADVNLSEVFIFETAKGGTYEYITDFYDNANEFEEDQTQRWYLNKNKLKLVCNGVEYSDIRYTFKDYLLTTISRLKNPTSFNIWYNEGENMLSEVSSAVLSNTNSTISKSIAEVKCCQLTRGIGKTVFATAEASTIANGLLKTSNITKVNSDPNEFYYATKDYDTHMRLIESKNEDNVVVQYTYNDFGEILTEKTFPVTNTTMNILVSKTYQNGNLTGVTEKRYDLEYTKAYEYNEDHILTNEITANGQYINYTHTPDGEKLTELKADVGGINENDISYTGDLVCGMEHNGTAVTFEYDERNAVNCVKVEGNSILSKEITYGAYNTQSVTTYANGAVIKKYYDKYNRLIKVTEIEDESETQLCAYIYSDYPVESIPDTVVSPTDSSLQISESSKLRVFIDNTANKRTKYIYDEFGALKEKQTGDIREYISEKDAFSRTAKTVFTDGVKSIENSFEYENSNSDRVTNETVSVDGASIDISYNRDALKRMSYITTTENGTGYIRTFGYVPRGTEGTTGYIEKMYVHKVINNVPTLEKIDNVAYNHDGNIITYGENTYVYDNLGRLVRENNKNLDKTFAFVYNVGGNIVSKNEYVYSVGELGEPTKTYSYSYENTWKDLLTSFDGQSIVYDASGNPTSYMGAILSWDKGRLLKQFIKGAKSVTMHYDANGIRCSKVLFVLAGSRIQTNFVYDSEGRLRTETVGTNTRYYLYSSDGIIGYEENGQRYLFRKNLFGDITSIYKGTTKLAEYEYDAWGNCTITLDTNSVGKNNPFRYRGYYWDDDLKMYYLMSRYYDPKTGRFINADSFEYLEPKAINGLNLYAYCRNNPVMYVDSCGTTLIDDLIYSVSLIANSVEYICVVLLESITYDVGIGFGFGGEGSIGKLVSAGALIRQDFLTIEKQAGSLTTEYTRIGQKYEEYYGLSFLFGLFGKGKEKFSCFFTPQHNSEDSMDMDLDINIGVGGKVYFILGGTFEFGFDLDYFITNMVSGRFATVYGYGK